MKPMKDGVEKQLAEAVATYFALRQDRIATDHGVFEMTISTLQGGAVCKAKLTSKSGAVVDYFVEVNVTRK